jgi:hypothetical protein
LKLLENWSEKWQMDFNLDKCKVMHIGLKNPHAPYTFMGAQLSPTNLEKDLGIYISSNLKVNKQCVEAEKKAMNILRYIKRQFTYRTQEIIIPLYTSLVRPILEYAVQVWSPQFRKDIIRLERVQARATKLIPNLRLLSYENRLEMLNMMSLETRRLRSQLIEVYKIIHGIDKLDFEQFFSFSNNVTRGNGFKLEVKRFSSTPCEHFFTYYVINPWNALPGEVVGSTSLTVFKKRLDEILPLHGPAIQYNRRD